MPDESNPCAFGTEPDADRWDYSGGELVGAHRATRRVPAQHPDEGDGELDDGGWCDRCSPDRCTCDDGERCEDCGEPGTYHCIETGRWFCPEHQRGPFERMHDADPGGWEHFERHHLADIDD